VIALVNTLNLKKLHPDGCCAAVQRYSDRVFSHIPLFAMYPDWGWGTEDTAQALGYLRRFSSGTCLNGHVHQLFSKDRGQRDVLQRHHHRLPVTHPGDGPAPKPITLPAGKLPNALGIRQVSYMKGQQALALKEQTLS
jgi:hypothetical protein